MAKILLVDDTIFVRTGLKKILEDMGNEIVAEASNGREAVRLFLQHKPDLVTLDITMPEMDGITALKEIKKIDQHARVIMCTTLGRKDKVVEAVAAGASDFIIKPYLKERVIDAVEKQVKAIGSK